ncbi:SGNH/GDSL hydrolase family protein [Pseudomonas sp. AU8050]|uniref:SGNH/GDSL hydrolase family protein n=1 Tax=Pseudomonas sp. AU8050 TaxID=2681497 RepID=UPI00140B08F4|nr:SGNH/GDSL hydrolase family protein [Pseudomonas sp. AU8050]
MRPLLLSTVYSFLLAFMAPTYGDEKNPAFIDLHFGTLSGVGWYPVETGGVVETSANASVSAGSFTIPVSSTAGFSRGQLACYEAQDQTYYPVVIKAIEEGKSLRIDRPLPAPIAAGGKFYNFYNNDAHANHYGFSCVVDDALRQLEKRPMLREASKFKVASGWEPINGAQVQTIPTAGYGDAGGQMDDGLGIAVHVRVAGGGVATKPEVARFENMVTNVVINPGTHAGQQSAELDISVTELRQTGEVIEVAKVRVNRDDTIISQDIRYTVVAGSKVRVKVTVPTSGDAVFYPGSITNYHALAPAEDYNHGKHVLFGDSWFASGGDFHYRLITRLNNAKVISKGIVGNRSDELVARFFKDVAKEKPDYVWIMVGTNDYYHDMPNQLFQAQMAYLLSYIQSIGAKPIFFNPTVGAIVPGTNVNQLLKSRSYALNTLYVPSVMYLRSPLKPSPPALQ